MEGLANTEIAVFDKTGTLTEGVFEVQKIVTSKELGFANSNFEVGKDELLKLVASCENDSNHPIAISIKNEYNKKI